jgi:hypothetical protein
LDGNGRKNKKNGGGLHIKRARTGRFEGKTIRSTKQCNHGEKIDRDLRKTIQKIKKKKGVTI